MLQRLRAEFRETREAIELLSATAASLREESPNELPELETIANASHLYERVRLMRDGLASLVPRIVEPTLREEAARLRSDAERSLSAFDVLCETNAVLGAALRQGNASPIPDRQGDSAENIPQRVTPNDSAASTVRESVVERTLSGDGARSVGANGRAIDRIHVERRTNGGESADTEDVKLPRLILLMMKMRSLTTPRYTLYFNRID
ncbi:hypothetical protein F1559_004282 [Cyanidiococcus yangmingshanensis]|uniref:Uncharacterized protein n=1 Tax=Cyanidiococcus yangmingshanensis TaxID=2690220 RepID=A0A7J7IQE2_9RHOD|nr:hypothetical protein F1559_004282 [Cyanidiococcus yangmingshanensis]